MEEMKNAVGYVRVSTDNQVGEDKYGIRAQKKDITDYAAKNHMVITGWYVDEGKSGAKEDRPEFDKLIYGDEIGNPPVQAVIVAKSDRIARDINIYYYYKHELMKKNLELISVADDFGAAGTLAPILETFVVMMAQLERDNINKRTSGGRRIKAAIGGYSGGNIPYGYKSENKRYAIVEDEAKVVRRIFSMDASGLSLRKIASVLASEGILNRSGEPITYNNVRSILSNRKTYEGFYKYGTMQDYVKGNFEPILK